MKTKLIPTTADKEIQTCIDESRNFSVIAGAGSGKTQSLIQALTYIRESKAPVLNKNDQKIVCITFTNRAVEVISRRLNFDETFQVSTMHKFLWFVIKRFSRDIRDALVDHLIPAQIAKKQEDAEGNSKKAQAARDKIATLEQDLQNLKEITEFEYSDNSTFSNYGEGELSHDDIIAIAAHLITSNSILQKILSHKYPYIFVDEAQDTHPEIVTALNTLCAGEGLPLVGYFGDPVQQIYDKRAGDFEGPEGYKLVKKEENFRCSQAVVNLLNAFRTDIKQVSAGKAAEIDGSVELRIIQAEEPQGQRNRYTDEQIETALAKFSKSLDDWGMHEGEDTKYLFLVRQMIARRLGFMFLQKLFTGDYASTRAQDDYESGEHFLLKPFIKTICPLLAAFKAEAFKEVLEILWKSCPAFDPKGHNAHRKLSDMRTLAKSLVDELSVMWSEKSLGEILQFCREKELIQVSDRLAQHLDRPPREEDFNKDEHQIDKEDWLADEFLCFKADQIEPYVDFINDNTPYSTQHGVKGEEYRNVVVVFDDIEASWYLYSFTKMLAPELAERPPTEGQLDRSTKIAYVSFSRAIENLRILLFTSDPKGTKRILLGKGLFLENQIVIEE